MINLLKKDTQCVTNTYNPRWDSSEIWVLHPPSETLFLHIVHNGPIANLGYLLLSSQGPKFEAHESIGGAWDNSSPEGMSQTLTRGRLCAQGKDRETFLRNHNNNIF